MHSSKNVAHRKQRSNRREERGIYRRWLSKVPGWQLCDKISEQPVQKGSRRAEDSNRKDKEKIKEVEIDRTNAPKGTERYRKTL